MYCCSASLLANKDAPKHDRRCKCIQQTNLPTVKYRLILKSDMPENGMFRDISAVQLVVNDAQTILTPLSKPMLVSLYVLNRLQFSH